MTSGLTVIDQSTGEVVTHGGVLQLADSLESVVAAFRGYQRACEALLTADDYQTIGGRRFKRKSAFRKLATAFSVSTSIVQRSIEYGGDGRIHHAEFVVRAVAPNGRSAEAWGGASVTDRDYSHDQDVAATAQTRASSRAIADLIGAGEVSAEEVAGGEDDRPRPVAHAERTGGAEVCPMGHPVRERNGKHGVFRGCVGKLADGSWHNWGQSGAFRNESESAPTPSPNKITENDFWREWSAAGRTVLEVVDAMGLQRDAFPDTESVRTALQAYVQAVGSFEELLTWKREGT